MSGSPSAKVGIAKTMERVTRVLVDAPLAGSTFLIGGDAEHPTLTLMDDQIQYVFQRSGG